MLYKDLETLHAVVILLKPNEARLTYALRYSITQLLKALPKGFASNIFFCMTNARNTMFGVGETGKNIKQLLKELKIETGE